MKRTAKYSAVIILMLCAGRCICQSYYSNDNVIYFGAGTSVASYWGGYFGNAYHMKAFFDDYYNDYYYNHSYSGSYYDNQYTLWSPLVFNISSGVNVTPYLSIEANASFLFCFDGNIDPEFKTGSSGSRDYIDRNSYSNLFAIPVSALLNLHSPLESDGSVYLKFGPSFQYTNESYDRIREFYDNSKYGSYTYSIGYLGTVEKSKWLPGFSASMGLEYWLGDGMTSVTELSYSYYKNTDKNNSTALAIDRAPEAQLFSLSTSFRFSF